MAKRPSTRRHRILTLIVTVALVGSGVATAQPRADHVVLVSVDGLRPEFYLDGSWPAPMMQQMAREGAHAEAVRSVFPSVTYPSHTTMVTGALPAHHGIYYNRPFEPGGQTGRWYWEEAAIHVPTLWDAVQEKGLKSAAISWPATVGAPIDWLLPEVWSLVPGSDRLAPMREGTSPLGLWEEIQREATGHLSLRTFSASYMNRDDNTAAAAAYLLETYRPALLAFHLISPDHFQHEAGRDAPIVRRALSAADRGISAVVEAAQRAGILDRTAFIITGDHGFVDVHTELAPNVWLAEAELMEAKADRGVWYAAFHTHGGSAFLHLKDPEDDEALEEVFALLFQLPESTKKLFRLVEREELDLIGADPTPPLALAAAPGIAFTSRAAGELLSPGEGGTHGYFPDFQEIHTGFVGWGAGFRPGAVAPMMGLEDIAPLIAKLLELPFEAPDGVCPLGLLTQPKGE